MFLYVIRRIIWFIPTLLIIILLGFIISVNAPGDPVERMIGSTGLSGESKAGGAALLQQKKIWRHKLGLDLPVFYFSFQPASYPDTLYRIYDTQERTMLERLLDQTGNWEAVSNYYESLGEFQTELIHASDSGFVNGLTGAGSKEETIFLLNTLMLSFDKNQIAELTAKLKELIFSCQNTALKNSYLKLEVSQQKMYANTSVWKNYIPVMNFFIHNQFHRWLLGDGQFSKGILRGDFGISYYTKGPVSEVIYKKIGWSLFFSLFSILLAYLVSIPVGVRAARNIGSKFDNLSSIILFMLYALPSFFVAVVLLMTFANPDVLGWLPASGIKPATGYPEQAGIFDKIRISLPHLIIPLVCYSYSSFAFISRLVRSSMAETMQMDFIRTAYAKGLPENRIIWHHGFRNSLFPLITVFANVFPSVIGGSVILETIFTIPGMGYESYLAIATQNHPVIIAILTLTSILTLTGYLVADVLYVLADPRVRIHA